MTKAKLILLNGFNASGKTTIAQKYISDHSLAFSLEADALVDNIGDWTNHREEVQELSFALTAVLIRTYLPSGHDVVLPYIVTILEEVETFEAIANECGADFYEIVLHDEHDDAVAKLRTRGQWGEASSPLITDEDLPMIEKDFAAMEAVLAKRPQTITIPLKGDSPNDTYRQLIRIVESE